MKFLLFLFKIVYLFYVNQEFKQRRRGKLTKADLRDKNICSGVFTIKRILYDTHEFIRGYECVQFLNLPAY